MKDIKSKLVKILKFDGRGKSLCQKTINISLKIIGLSSKITKQKFLFRQKFFSKGAILIEFAFCLPVLIVLVYYIYDLNRYKRYYSKMEFVAQQMASIIQNISQNREDKTIKFVDIRNAMKAAFLTVYPGTSMYMRNGGFEFGHCPQVSVFYVKGLENGNASCLYYVYTIAWSWSRFVYYSRFAGNMVKYGTDVPPSSIYPSLTINPGEVKIIIEVSFRRSGSSTQTPDGRILTDKQAFGFYLLSPKNWGNYGYFFNSVVIFTPRPGLFSETPST